MATRTQLRRNSFSEAAVPIKFSSDWYTALHSHLPSITGLGGSPQRRSVSFKRVIGGGNETGIEPSPIRRQPRRRWFVVTGAYRPKPGSNSSKREGWFGCALAVKASPGMLDRVPDCRGDREPLGDHIRGGVTVSDRGPDPISAGTAGYAARWGGSSAAVGMGRTRSGPTGSTVIGSIARAAPGRPSRQGGECRGDRPSIRCRGTLPILPGIEHRLRLPPPDQPLELAPAGPHPEPELGRHRVVLRAVDLTPPRWRNYPAAVDRHSSQRA